MVLKSVGGYIRVSTQEQSQKGLSLETQTAEIKDYCKRMGYKLTKIYVDRGITARKNLYKRESFMDMMQDVKDQKINHIVILRLDRFFRNVYDYHRMMNEYLIPNDCGWSAIKEDYDTTTTNGRLMINLRLSIAEQECDQDSDRIKDIFENRIKEGYVVTGTCPKGYKIENKRLVPSDDAPLVQDIFKTFQAVGSVRQTMILINAKYKLNLLYSTVIRILQNPIYTGTKRNNTNYCQALVSADDFRDIQDLISKNLKVRKNQYVYIFSGIIHCACCGYKMSGTVNERPYGVYKYYRCNNSYLNGKCKNRVHPSEKLIEEYLLNNVETLLKNYIIEIEVQEKVAPKVKSNREQIEIKLNRLKDLYVNGVIDMEELKHKKAELESQIIDVEDTPKKDLSKVTKFLNSGFRNIYNYLTEVEKRTLWRSVIKDIRMKGKEIKEVIFL